MKDEELKLEEMEASHPHFLEGNVFFLSTTPRLSRLPLSRLPRRMCTICRSFLLPVCKTDVKEQAV
jgi:hypothetical protein